MQPHKIGKSQHACRPAAVSLAFLRFPLGGWPSALKCFSEQLWKAVEGRPQSVRGADSQNRTIAAVLKLHRAAAASLGCLHSLPDGWSSASRRWYRQAGEVLSLGHLCQGVQGNSCKREDQHEEVLQQGTSMLPFFLRAAHCVG